MRDTAPSLPRWTWGEPVEPLREVLAAGGILVIPTESSYGLAVDPGHRRGVEAVYEVKERERGKPLPVVVADVEQALDLGVSPEAPELAVLRELWPAPLTAVLPLVGSLPAAAGGTTLAVRVPAHPRLRRLLKDVGSGVTATSANRAGEPPILDPRHLDRLVAGSATAVVIDDGLLPGGPPSTLVSWQGGTPSILRQGAFPSALLQRSALPAGGPPAAPAEPRRRS